MMYMANMIFSDSTWTIARVAGSSLLAAMEILSEIFTAAAYLLGIEHAQTVWE